MPLLIGRSSGRCAAGSLQLVTVVGEPGVGKSRLSPSCSRTSTSEPELSAGGRGGACRMGRGSRSGRWARSSRREAGILESDSPEVAAAKLDAASPRGPGAAVVVQRLAPLVGVEAASPAERQELFAAWRRFLEGSLHPVRACSCSRICTGRTTPCSPSSSTWPTGRRGCRCWWSAPPGPSCTRRIRVGRGDPERVDDLARSAV